MFIRNVRHQCSCELLGLLRQSFPSVSMFVRIYSSGESPVGYSSCCFQAARGEHGADLSPRHGKLRAEAHFMMYEAMGTGFQ